MVGARPVVRSIERRRPVDPRIGGIEPARLEESALAATHLDLGEAVAVEVAAQRRNDVVDVGADHVA